MSVQASFPRPWWQAGLTALPGLVGLLGSMLPRGAGENSVPRAVMLAPLALLILSGILRAVVRRSAFGEGYLSAQDGGWRGLCVASVQYAREHGLDALVDLVVRQHGLRMDHSPYMHKSPAEVLRMLGGAKRPPGDQRRGPTGR
jgi:hypothetical protein